MKPALATAVTLVQFLVTLALGGTTVYLLWLTHSPEILQEADAADAIHGLRIGALAIGIPALFFLFGSWGLWKNKRWGWWLATLTNAVLFAVLAYGTFDENSIDWEEVAITVCFAVVCTLLFLPTVRKFYWKTQPPQPLPAAFTPSRDS